MAEKELTKAKARESCVYRLFQPIFVRASGQALMGRPNAPLIVDLSDVSDEMIRWMLERKWIESAEGKPINKPTGAVKREPCPCQKE